MNDIIAGVLATAAKEYEVKVVAVAALSTHMHVLAVFLTCGSRRRSAQHVASNIARAATPAAPQSGALLGRSAHGYLVEVLISRRRGWLIP